ncbi:MAG: hypothetical protein ACK4RK_07225 [Gemmataceae bacterium]
MLRQCGFVGGVLTCLFIVSQAPAQEFKEFSSAAGRFKVQMPGAPKESSLDVAGTTAKLFLVEVNDSAYLASYADMPIPANEGAEQTQMRLDGAVQGMVTNVNGKLTKETKIKLGQYPGRAVEAELPQANGYLRARIYMVDRRLYQLVIAGDKQTVYSKDAEKFLGSLVLIK